MDVKTIWHRRDGCLLLFCARKTEHRTANNVPSSHKGIGLRSGLANLDSWCAISSASYETRAYILAGVLFYQ